MKISIISVFKWEGNFRCSMGTLKCWNREVQMNTSEFVAKNCNSCDYDTQQTAYLRQSPTVPLMKNSLDLSYQLPKLFSSISMIYSIRNQEILLKTALSHNVERNFRFLDLPPLILMQQIHFMGSSLAHDPPTKFLRNRLSRYCVILLTSKQTQIKT